jgi:RNA-directed DNA polymerase
MARQKSEDRIKPQGHRKVVVTRRGEPRGGGEAIPVDERTRQRALPFGTAEVREAQAKRVDGGAEMGRPMSATHAKPKPKSKEKKVASVTMEEVTKRLGEAFQKVASNKGAAGPDGKSIEEVREHLDELWPQLGDALLAGTYRPGESRRVWLPKAGGGERGLGIPNEVDRRVQEAIRAVLEPQYEPTFHEGSHGFRPGRSCHTAIARAVQYVKDGYEGVVDIDLEKFFDKVNHDILMARPGRA